MSIYLGNLSVEQMEARAGFEFPLELRKLLSETHQDSASNVQKGKWHCFDIPFVLVCGDIDFAKEIYSHLQPLSSKFETPMQISVARNDN